MRVGVAVWICHLRAMVWALACTLVLLAALGALNEAAAVNPPASAASVNAAPDGIALTTITPGTVITVANWQRYKEFMPYGMQALFEGTRFWKMPPELRMVVGPTLIHPLPKTYLAATEKYASAVKIVDLPNGGLTTENYVAGMPFPNPSDPHKGWKILADVWYRYIPHVIAATPEHLTNFFNEDRYGNISWYKTIFVYHQLMHNTDPGVPLNVADAGDRQYTEWSMVEEPEQYKYQASLTIFYDDLRKPEDRFTFVPELRRALRGNSAARCAPVFGSDMTGDDLRYGFNGNLTLFQAKFLGERKILALTDYNVKAGDFPDEYYMPLGWPKPSWGDWELRDVYVIEVARVPAEQARYCYGKRIMYVDKETFAPLWEDLYDMQSRFWKIMLQCPRARMVPGIGVENVTGSSVSAMWDLVSGHTSRFVDPTLDGYDVLMNEEVPEQYQNVTRYGAPAGLNEIMR